MLNKNSNWWQYLSKPQQNLIQEAFYLLEDSKTHPPAGGAGPVSDYSYLVFPVAKAYEGFLKQIFLDMDLIKKWQYESDHFRIGKALSPNLARKLRKNSIYGQLVSRGLKDLADKLWNGWKQGRNLVFHYFPHNFRALTQDEAEKLMNELVSAMKEAVSISQKVKEKPKPGVWENSGKTYPMYMGKSNNWFRRSIGGRNSDPRLNVGASE